MTAETIQALFERACAEFADRECVVGGGVRWTYAELAERVRGLAARLREAGVAPGDRVAVLDGNTPFFLAAYFAAPWVGAVLQPLNHRLAAAELAAILADAETRVLCADRELAELAPPALRVLPAVLDAVEADLAPHVSQTDDLAQLYYSGAFLPPRCSAN